MKSGVFSAPVPAITIEVRALKLRINASDTSSCQEYGMYLPFFH
jgi:hypothetical protein